MQHKNFYSYIRPLLFALEPEKAHAITLRLLHFYYSPRHVKRMIKHLPKRPVNVFGLTFPNPVGLAAGLAKEGDYVDSLFGLGFGFVELGTITPFPQPGNPKPRIFRIPEAEALINRMGFPSKGINHFVKCMQRRKVPGIVGVNIGMNKTTPLANAIDDYRFAMIRIYPYADFLTLNISSPNTPGLRELQGRKYLENLLSVMRTERDNLADQYNKKIPLLIKISVDLDDLQLLQVIDSILENNIDGVIATNTSTDHQAVTNFENGNEQGGLSGRPIFEKSTNIVRKIHQHSNGQLPIIAVGGIMSPDDAQAKIDAGARLIQIYTGLIYKGPKLIHDIITHLRY